MRCQKCKKPKAKSAFSKNCKICKLCYREYYRANRAKRLAYQAAYYEAHKAEISPKAIKRTREWVAANPERHAKNCREWFRRKYHFDAAFRAKIAEKNRRYREKKRAERAASAASA